MNWNEIKIKTPHLQTGEVNLHFYQSTSKNAASKNSTSKNSTSKNSTSKNSTSKNKEEDCSDKY